MLRTLRGLLLLAATAAALAAQVFVRAGAGGGQSNHFEGTSMFGQKSASAAEDFSWRGRVRSGGAVEIKGLRGDIRAEPSSGDEVVIVASKKGAGAEAVSVKVLEHEGGVTVCAVYPASDPKQPYVCRAGSEESEFENLGLVFFRANKVGVDFTVRVPAGVRFVGRTLKGSVQASALKGDVEVFAAEGDVRVSAAGSVRARTMTGSIDVSLEGARPSGPTHLQTVKGNIVVALPAGANASVRAETSSGRISTDFPLTFEKGFGRRKVNGVIGSGGGELSMKTVSGGIQLRRAP